MKISFEKKIIAGFIINLLIVGGLGWIYLSRTRSDRDQKLDSAFDWLEMTFLVLSAALLTVVFFIIRAQLMAKNASQKLLFDNKQLLQSIVDSSSTSISIKKINGEYLLVNKQFESLFKITNEEIKGKTDHDFLSKEIADTYRNSDLEVVKARKEIKVEETITQKDGPHTYFAVKFPLYDSSGRIYAIGAISTDITEKKVLENTLKEGDKFFNMSLDILVIANSESFVKINPTLTKILGYSEKELLSTSFFTYIHPDDLKITEKEIAKLQSGISTINFENRWISKDGSIRWLSWIASPDPQTGLLYAVAHDITEKKELEESLKVADKFFNMSFDMLVVAKGEYFIKVNPAFTRILGYNQKDMDDRPFLSFAHPDDAVSAHESIEKLQKGEPVINFKAKARCKDGSYKLLDWTATADRQSGLIYAVARDVTKQAENEESLKMVNSFFEMSFDILFVSKDRKFIKINPAFTKTLGYIQKDLDKITFLEVLHPDDREIAQERVANLMKGGENTSFAYRVMSKDGTYKLIEVISTYDAINQMIFSVGRDVTEKVKNEDSVRMADMFFRMSFDMLVVLEGENLIRINPAFTKTLGYTQKDLETIHFLDLSEDVPRTTEAISKLQKGENLVNFRDYVKRKDGSHKWVEWNATIDSKTGTMYLIARDITEKMELEKEQQKAVEQLYENEQKLKLIIDNIGEGVIVANTEKKILLANYMANELFGIEDDTQISANFSDQFELYLPDEKTIFPSQNLPMDRALRGEATDDIDVVFWNPTAQEKKRVLLSGRPILDQDNQVIAAVITIKDISRYKQMEEDLKETELKYRRLIGFRKNDEQ